MIYLSEYDSVGRQQDKHTEHELGRRLLRFGLERGYGEMGTVVLEESGRPVLEGKMGVYFNISHTAGLVVCGIGDRPIGVDVEYIRSFDRRLMRRVCTEEEIAYIEQKDGGEERQWERFFRLWTLKESFLKATGQGIAVPMDEICFSVEEGKDGLVGIRSDRPGWRFWQFRYGGRFLVSTAEKL